MIHTTLTREVNAEYDIDIDDVYEFIDNLTESEFNEFYKNMLSNKQQVSRSIYDIKTLFDIEKLKIFKEIYDKCTLMQVEEMIEEYKKTHKI